MRRLVLLDAAVEDFADIFEHLTKESSDRAVGRKFVTAVCKCSCLDIQERPVYVLCFRA
jgi:hypothetical protein